VIVNNHLVVQVAWDGTMVGEEAKMSISNKKKSHFWLSSFFPGPWMRVWTRHPSMGSGVLSLAYTSP
jgi:hypothetical protein